MPRAEGVGCRIELLLDEPRPPALLAVVPPVGEKLQFGHRDAAVRGYPAQVGRRQPAVPAGAIIFHRQPEGGKAGLSSSLYPLLEGKAGGLTDRGARECVVTGNQVVAAEPSAL